MDILLKYHVIIIDWFGGKDMTLVMAGLIYSALVLGAFAKYYYYYNIRGSDLLLCPIMPLILFVVIPISMAFDILKDKTTSLWVKLVSILAVLISSIFSYPISIGISAVYLTTNKDEANENITTSCTPKGTDNGNNIFELYDLFICRLAENINHLHRRLA